MRIVTLKSIRRASLGALLVTPLVPASAQEPIDAPAAVIQGTCRSIDFNRASISAPIRVDVAVKVDESGNPTSVAPVADVPNLPLLNAVLAAVKTCKFQPAMHQGKPTPGTARMVHQFAAAPTAAPLARRASISDVRSCAPTADDYPEASRRLNETGTTRVSFTVSPGGRLTAFGVVRSSGHLRLDFAALIKLAGCRFQSATLEDGTPTSATLEVEYVWKLE
jgi:TonB family protein